jgi:hypothetical protein
MQYLPFVPQTQYPTITLILCTVRPQRLSNQYHHPLLLRHTTLDKPDTAIVWSCPQLDLGMLGHAYINSGSSVALCSIHLPIVPMCPIWRGGGQFDRRTP